MAGKTTTGTPRTRSAAQKAPAAATKKATAAKKSPAAKSPAAKTAAATAAATTKTAPAGEPVAASAAVASNGSGHGWTAAELDAVRAELLAHLDRLNTELAVADDQIAELIRDTAGSAGDDPADTGSKAFEREHGISLANNARELIKQNNRALRRIDDGTYGRCEVCENEIGKGRLQAFPRATLCVTCKQKQERH